MVAVLAEQTRARIVRHESPGGRWELAFRPPPLEIRRHVREYCGYLENRPTLLRRREFPMPEVVAIFDLGPPLRLLDGAARQHEGGFVAGLTDAPAETEHDGFWRGIQVNFTPAGARLVFGVSMAELSRRDVALSDLLAVSDRSLPSRLREASGWDARFDRGPVHPRTSGSGPTSPPRWATTIRRTSSATCASSPARRRLSFGR